MKLRVYHLQNCPSGKKHFYKVESPEEAIKVIQQKAKEDLQNPKVVMNVFGLEVFNEEERKWEEWYGVDGEDIDQYQERLQEEEDLYNRDIL